MAIMKRIVCIQIKKTKPDNNRTLSLPTIDLMLIISLISTNLQSQQATTTKPREKQSHMLFLPPTRESFQQQTIWNENTNRVTIGHRW